MPTVLIVDDRAVNRELLVTLLEYRKHRVLQAADGAEALAIARAERPELIITDILMPTMDGYELVRQLRADSAIAHIPVIFYTAHYHKHEVRRLATSCGVAHIIMKPSEPEMILRTVDEALAAPMQIVGSLSAPNFDREHVRVITDKLAKTADRLRLSNERLGETVQTLEEREAGLSRAQSMAMLAHVITGPDGAFETWSATLPSLIGVQSTEMPASAREWLKLLHPDDCAIFRSKSIEAAANRSRMDVAYRLRRVDGAWIQIRQVSEPLQGASRGDNLTRWFNTLQDVTLQKNAEEKIARLNRVHATLSGINTLIVRVHNRDELFNEACRIAVDHGGFGIAWIGSYDPLTRDITPVAWAGIDGDAIKSMIRNTRASTPNGRGMASQAVREKKPMYSNDVTSEAGIGAGGRREAIARGYRSLIALPLLVNGNAVGNLSLFARESDFFNANELKLMNELAGDISFALENIDKEEKIARLSRIQAVTSGINALIVRIHDGRELFNEACRIVVEHGSFGIAWIGTHDLATQDVIPVAWAGENAAKITSFKSSSRHGSPRGKGAVGQAIREKRIICNNDIESQGFGGPRLKGILELGFRSQITLPLFVDEAVVAALTIYATEQNFFDAEEIRLLAELGSNISLALAHISNEQKISRLSRVRQVTSGINSLMVRVRDRQELLNEACRIAVEHGKFGAAWIGTYDTATQMVTPVAWADSTAKFLRGTLATSAADIAKSRGVVSQAVREKRPVFDNDIASASKERGPRRLAAIDAGFNSLTTLPFIVGDEVVGNFSLYSHEINFFNEDEVKLLAELAGNISFALELIDRQEKIDKLSRIRAVSSEVNAAIARISERDALLKSICRIAVEHGKFELVWIGTLDYERQKIVPVAWSGFTSEIAHEMDWGVIGAQKVTLAEVVKTGQIAVRNHLASEPNVGILRKEALKKNCGSSVCLPVVIDGKVTAAVILFAAGANFFDEDELALLNEAASDISFALDRIAKAEKLNYLAYYDELTGLPNRTLLQDYLGRVLRRAKDEGSKAALVMCDIKRFSQVNETLGRKSGDALLRQFAQRLKKIWPEPDNVGRLSADYFGGIVANIRDASDIAHLIEHPLATALSEPFLVGGEKLRIAVTAGIAICPDDGNDTDVLFKNAEAALKKAKGGGDKYLFYHAKMNAAVTETLRLENNLRRAIDQEEFVLHYQPKFNLDTGEISGLEALIRWNDPAIGLVPPGNFIPLLEETGMILDVGIWAVKRALHDYHELDVRGLKPPSIAVNVSLIQLRQKNFVELISQAIKESKATRHGLDLEITESLIMDDIEGNIQKLKTLRAMGINIAIDDFGTGYSSLRYLARLPVNLLKIDRSFIITMTNDADSMSIVSTIISLAHSLNMKVIAEGVEIQEQSRFLKLLKCDEVQGFLFSKPLPLAQLAKMLEGRTRG